MKRKNLSIISVILFLVLCFGMLFLSSDRFVDAETAPKTYFCIFGTLLLCLVFTLYSFRRKISVNELAGSFCYAVTVSVFALSVQGILQFFGVLQGINGFTVTGSFDNPAGFAACLCSGFPFVFYFLNNGSKTINFIAVVTLIINALAVCMSESRAGILSLCIVALAVLFQKIRMNKYMKIIVACILLSVFASGLYFLKKDSADGRLLIWQISAEMIKNKPLTGFGPGGFKANYMNFQADFFAENTDNKFAMLAII